MKNSVFIAQSAVVSDSTEIGEGTYVWHHTQIREEARIGKNCRLGKSVYVGARVRIGNNVKIQNRVSLYEGVTIEDDVFLGPHVAFTNDMYPRAFNKEWKIIPTLVKRGASIATNSTIICGVTIGEYAMVGAGSVVTKDVSSYALVFGNPARLRGIVCKCGRSVDLDKGAEKEGKVSFNCGECGEEITVLKGFVEQVKSTIGR